MAVIYLPPDPNDWSRVGVAAAQAAGQIAKRQRTLSALEALRPKVTGSPLGGVEIQKPPTDPLEQIFAAVKAGMAPEEAGQLVQFQQQAQLAQARVRQMQAATTQTEQQTEQSSQLFPHLLRQAAQKTDIGELDKTLKQLQIQQAPLQAQLEQARTRLAEAQARGIESDIRLEGQKLKLLERQAAAQDLVGQFVQRLMGEKQTGAPPVMPAVPGVGPTPQVQPQSFQQSDTTVVPAPGASPTEAVLSAGPPGVRLAQNAPAAGDQLSNMIATQPPEVQAEFTARLLDVMAGKGKMGDALAVITKANEPEVDIRTEQVGPEGSIKETAKYITTRKGTTRQVLSRVDTRATPLTQEDAAKSIRGAMDLHRGIKQLEKLTEEAEKRGGKLGGPIIGRFQKLFIDWGVNPPVGDNADLAVQYEAVWKQFFDIANTSIVGVPSNTDIAKFEAMTPKLTDSTEVRKAKIAAIQNMIDYKIKYALDQFEGSRFVPPKTLLELAQERGIRDTPIQEIDKRARAALNKATKEIAPEGGRGDSVKIGDQEIPMTEINKAAKQYGYTPQEMINYLRSQKEGKKRGSGNAPLTIPGGTP